MRRSILLLCCFALLLVAAPAALADTPSTGCPAETSAWTQVAYGNPNYKDNSLYKFYFVDNSSAGLAFMDLPDVPDKPKDAYFLLESILAPVDGNGDKSYCVSWLGANPGIPDNIISIVDNNSATKS